MKKLNEQQRKAAEFTTGIAGVVAIPGSGKTLTMTWRIGNLVKTHGIPPESILGLTFTRNAALAMKEKLRPILEETASRVTLATIHSFCNSLLRNEGMAFEILSGKDQLKFVRKIMQKAKINDFPTGMVLREISLAKSNVISADEFRALYEGDLSMQKIADIYAAYEREKKIKGFLDFDDLLTESLKLLQERPEVMERYRGTFRHILVDEFQDTNPAQMEILRLLIAEGNGGSFWICGDDWQSIYAFTGASVGNILNFRRMFPKAHEFVLNINYRSTPQILTACQNLIRHNIRKIDKTLNTGNPSGENVVVLEANTEDNEAELVANEILDLVENRGFAHKDIGVLYRANFQSRAMEETLSRHDIPYHVENGHGFFQRFEVRILLDYLRLIQVPDSDEGDDALRSIINVPNRYMGRKFLSDLEEHSASAGLHLYKGLKTLRVSPPYLKKSAAGLVAILDPLIENATKLEPAEIIMMLREALDFDRFIAEDDIPSPDDLKLANIQELQIMAGRFKEISGLLSYAETFREEKANDKNGVSLMTIHKAKGLEFPVVFVIGMVEGILPNKNGEIEEERRIAFVGMSRAMRLLYLAYSRHCLGRPAKPSSFLQEIFETG